MGDVVVLDKILFWNCAQNWKQQSMPHMQDAPLVLNMSTTLVPFIFLQGRQGEMREGGGTLGRKLTHSIFFRLGRTCSTNEWLHHTWTLASPPAHLPLSFCRDSRRSYRDRWRYTMGWVIQKRCYVRESTIPESYSHQRCTYMKGMVLLLLSLKSQDLCKRNW